MRVVTCWRKGSSSSGALAQFSHEGICQQRARMQSYKKEGAQPGQGSVLSVASAGRFWTTLMVSLLIFRRNGGRAFQDTRISAFLMPSSCTLGNCRLMAAVRHERQQWGRPLLSTVRGGPDIAAGLPLGGAVSSQAGPRPIRAVRPSSRKQTFAHGRVSGVNEAVCGLYDLESANKNLAF